MSVDISQLTESLPAEQRKAVQAAYKRQAKDATTAFLLCFFLGIFGIHCFYLGRVGQGIFRLIISPLIIPGLIWEVVDLPRIDREVHARNLKLAEQLVAGAMLAVPNSAALEAALSQLDATLHAQETQAVAAPAPADVAEPAPVPVSAPEPINPAAGRADEPGGAVADAALPPAGLDAAAEADAPAFAAAEDAANGAAPRADDMPVGLHGPVVPVAEPVAEPAPAPAAYEWAPQWPVDAAVALAAEHAALAETARDAVTASTAQERSSVDPPADVTSTMWDAAPVVEQSAAEVPAAPAEAATAWADEATGAPEPGTAALAFGWLQAAASGAADAPESAAAPESSAEPAPDPVDAWDTPTFVVPRAEPPAARAAAAWGAGDPTDQGMPLEEFGGTADPGELASADRVSVALAEGATEWPADGSVFEQDDGPQSVAVPGTDATEEPDAEQGAEPGAGETQSPVLVFVADEGSEPELRLTSDEVTLASLAGLAAASSVASAGSETGAEQASMPAEDAQPGGTLAGAMETGMEAGTATETEVPAPATDYRAEVMEEPHPSPAAPGAEQRRMVKRVRVVRRLVVNGQVVRETAAEQVIDADADAQATAAELQRTLGSADPETLAALADALDEPPAAPAQAPTPPAAAPDGPPAAREGPRQ